MPDQLLCAIGSWNRNWPHCTSIARAALKQRAIQDNAATHKKADIEIGKITQRLAMAKDQFGSAGSGAVIAGENREFEQFGQFSHQIKTAPAFEHVVGGANFLFPIPQFKGCGNAQA